MIPTCSDPLSTVRLSERDAKQQAVLQAIRQVRSAFSGSAEDTRHSLCITPERQHVHQHVAVISPADEALIWESGMLGMENPWALTCATFVTVGLHVCLRGGQEHRDLKIRQFIRVPKNGCYNKECFYEYAEHGSKNYQGKFAEMDSNNVSCAYAQPESPHCPVKILDIYLSELQTCPSLVIQRPFTCSLCKQCHPIQFTLGTRSLPLVGTRGRTCCQRYWSWLN